MDIVYIINQKYNDKTMIFKLNENESVELKYSFRSAIYFEQITNHNLDFSNMTQNDLLILFYSVVVASLQKANKPVITMLAFMDCIDDYNGGEQCLLDFANWYVDIMKKEFELLDSTTEEVVEQKPSKSKKKQV